MTDARSAPALAVVGATGAVGSVLLQILSQRADVWGTIRLIASPRSAGRRLAVRGEETEVLALTEDAFDGFGPGDVAVFLTPEDISARWAPVVTARGTAVVDRSEAFRLDPEVPLVVPEINPRAVRVRPRGIVAGPGPATLSMIAAVAALHAAYGLEELTLATYQAASGAGRAAPRRCAASSPWSPAPIWAGTPATYGGPWAPTPAPSRRRWPSTWSRGPAVRPRTAGPRRNCSCVPRRARCWAWSRCRWP